MKTGKLIRKIRLDNPEVLAERKMKREVARTGNTRFPTAREKARTNALLEKKLKKEREELYNRWATASEDKQDLASEVASGNFSRLVNNFDELSSQQQQAVLAALDDIANDETLSVNRRAKKFREAVGKDAWESNKQDMSGSLDVDESVDDLVNKKHKRLLSDDDTGEVFEPEFNHLDNASTNKQELIKLIQQQLTNSGEFVSNSSDQLLSAPVESLLKDNNQKRLVGMYKSTLKDVEKNRPNMLGRNESKPLPSSYSTLGKERKYALENYNRIRNDVGLPPVDEEGMLQAASNGDTEAAYFISHAKFKAADKFANKRETAIARSYEGLEGKADLDKHKIEYTRDGDGNIEARNIVDDVFYGNDTDYQNVKEITKHDRLLDDTPLDPEADRFLRKEGKLKQSKDIDAYEQQKLSQKKSMDKYESFVDEWEDVERVMQDANLSKESIEKAKRDFVRHLQHGFKNGKHKVDVEALFSENADKAPLSKRHIQNMLNKTKNNEVQRPDRIKVYDVDGNLVQTKGYNTVSEMSDKPRFKDVNNKKLWQETPRQQLSEEQLQRIEEAELLNERNRKAFKDADIVDEEPRVIAPQRMSRELNENEVLAVARRMQQAFNRAYPNKKLTTLNQRFIDKAIAEGNRPMTKKTGKFTASKPEPLKDTLPKIKERKDYHKATSTAQQNREVADFISSHMTRDRYNSLSSEERQKVIAEASEAIKNQKNDRRVAEQAERKARSDKAKDSKFMSTIPPSRREEVRAKAKSFIKYGDSRFEAHQKAWALMQQEDELASLMTSSGPFKKTQLEEAYERLR